MPASLSIQDFLHNSDKIPIIDVRAPQEFDKGHIPGAVNIPLFNDEERKKIGTTYKQIGKREAFLQGLELVGPKLRFFVEESSIFTTNKQLKVHCWRGGQRSQSFAWLLEMAGFKVEILKGGYKSYRHYILELLEQKFPLHILGGATGSGKTEILKQLAKLGEQVIDLEHLARHKGSVFGGLEQEDQPSNEHFQNRLGMELLKLNHDLPVWLEDESPSIGKVGLPRNFWKQMKQSFTVYINPPLESRIKRLIEDYACYSSPALINCVERLEKRLGGLRCKQVKEAIVDRDFQLALRILLDYYDRLYQKGLAKKESKEIIHLNLSSGAPLENAQTILQLLKDRKKIKHEQ